MRDDFPYFQDNDEVYFDNASTTQKPREVIQAVEKYLSKASNVGRGSYSLANQMTEKVEESRKTIAEFIGAEKDEIVFTSGATESLNMIPELVAEDIDDGQKILVSEEAHKSTRRPWLKLKEDLAKQGKNITIEEYGVLQTGDPDIDEILEKTDETTYLISVTHIHNAYGGKAEVKRLSKGLEHELLALDACQSIAHVPIDVEELGVDFLSFSGHKMFASTGTGGLYINGDIHDRIGTYQVGGGQGDEIPERLETGTPNISGIISMKTAVDYIQDRGIEDIREKNLELTKYLIKRLEEVGVEFEKGPYYANCEDVGYGIISFSVQDVPAKDIGFILNNAGIYVRDGKHCRDKGKNSVRISLQAYNTEEEIDRTVNALKKFI